MPMYAPLSRKRPKNQALRPWIGMFVQLRFCNMPIYSSLFSLKKKFGRTRPRFAALSENPGYAPDNKFQ